MIDSEDLLQRFLSYVQIDTQSDAHSTTTPSSTRQWTLIRQLESELRGLGLKDVRVTEFGYVLATVPPTSKKAAVPRVALLAHVDTAEGCAGRAKPLVHRAWAGERIVLPDDPSQVISVEDSPALRGKTGEDIITGSGRSLLGADDKAGVASIMAAVRYLLRHPEVAHGPVRVCFNPDEEIGRGTEKLSIEELAADVAYTLDSEGLGRIDCETFNADKAVLTIQGVASHPGHAKNVMVNALRLAASFVQRLPMSAAPETTSGREGFLHPIEIRGTPERAEIVLIVRDFELDGLAAKHKLLQEEADRLAAEHPRAKIDLRVSMQYRNMRYGLDKDTRPLDFAMEAVRRVGLTPKKDSIRGGTDGSHLTERGLPTPNIFAGGHNFHSPREWVSLQDMVKSAETIVRLLSIWEERG
ncbi:MAG TPA: peptidase T [Planctomycetota bacterium]|jgi:tripeptide aminopeptidase